MRLEDKSIEEAAWTIIYVKVKPSKSNPGYSHARDQNGINYLVLNKHIAEHLDDFNVVLKAKKVNVGDEGKTVVCIHSITYLGGREVPKK